MQRTIPQLIASLLAAPVLFVAATASAAPDASACGNFDLSSTVSCEVKVSGGCVTECEPVNFTAACDGECTVDVDTTCTQTCGEACITECTLNPGSFECSAGCSADCSAGCDADCEASADKASCSAECKASCQASCSADCKVVAPTATCEEKCAKVCSTSCETSARASCKYNCTAELTGGCKTQCESPEGALFCDGQYVNVSSFDDCEAYIESLDIEYTANAEGHCDASGCEGTADASVGCTTAPVGSAPFNVGAIAAMVTGLGLIVSRRRRRA